MTRSMSRSDSAGRSLPGNLVRRLIVILLVALMPAVCGGAEPQPSSANDRDRREGEDWPTFLGSRGTGRSGETGLLEPWPKDGPPVLWQKRVGTGYSAPSVLGHQLVLHHRVGDEEIVDCLHAATGEPIWRYAYESGFSDPYGYNNGPRCSPVLTEDRCYTFGAEGKLLCLDLKTGEKVWMRDALAEFDLRKENGEPNWFFGIGCTPILEGGLLIALVGGQPDSGVVAFDAETGETVWESVGRETWDGTETGWPQQPVYRWSGEDQVVSYSSPIAATIHGQRHILCLMRQGLVSLDPKDGSVRFKYWFMSRTYEAVNAARPLVIGDRIFLSAAYNVGAALLEVAPDGQSVREVWRNPRNMQAHWSTPIHVDGYIYGFSGRNESDGAFRCIDLRTGQIAWETNGFEGDLSDLEQEARTGRIRSRRSGKTVPWPFYGRGSEILADGKFIVLGERGTLALVRVSPERFEEISRASYEQISYPAWTAPVTSVRPSSPVITT
jgi:outer membrane protein assembly factor BamB